MKYLFSLLTITVITQSMQRQHDFDANIPAAQEMVMMQAPAQPADANMPAGQGACAIMQEVDDNLTRNGDQYRETALSKTLQAIAICTEDEVVQVADCIKKCKILEYAAKRANTEYKNKACVVVGFGFLGSVIGTLAGWIIACPEATKGCLAIGGTVGGMVGGCGSSCNYCCKPNSNFRKYRNDFFKLKYFLEKQGAMPDDYKPECGGWCCCL